jgi:hypothetical protein
VAIQRGGPPPGARAPVPAAQPAEEEEVKIVQAPADEPPEVPPRRALRPAASRLAHPGGGSAQRKSSWKEFTTPEGIKYYHNADSGACARADARPSAQRSASLTTCARGACAGQTTWDKPDVLKTPEELDKKARLPSQPPRPPAPARAHEWWRAGRVGVVP